MTLYSTVTNIKKVRTETVLLRLGLILTQILRKNLRAQLSYIFKLDNQSRDRNTYVLSPVIDGEEHTPTGNFPERLRSGIYR